jgi:hypothetical protein
LELDVQPSTVITPRIPISACYCSVLRFGAIMSYSRFYFLITEVYSVVWSL